MLLELKWLREQKMKSESWVVRSLCPRRKNNPKYSSHTSEYNPNSSKHEMGP